MVINEYKVLAMRTFANLSDEETLNNSVFGLVGESGEVIEIIGNRLYKNEVIDPSKLIEEIGDTMWYIAQFSHVCAISMTELFDGVESPQEYQLKRGICAEPSVVMCVFNLIPCMSKIVDIVKKHLHQGHPLDEDGIEIALKHIVRNLVDICINHGINFEDTLIGNIEKLKKRYPQGFCAQDSINRREEYEN